MPNSVKFAKVACAIFSVAAMLGAPGPAGARQKKWTQMNSCSCACRQDDGGPTVYISNKDFYSVAGCSSFNGTACDVTVSTSEGTHQVKGAWEGCIDHGKIWVRVKAAAPDDLRGLTVDPGLVLPPPTPMDDARGEEPMTADPGDKPKPQSDRRDAERAPGQILEAAPAEETPD